MTRPAQPPCKTSTFAPCHCSRWPFPHRLGLDCVDIDDEEDQDAGDDSDDEWAEERGLDERDRAREVNQQNRSYRK